MIKFKVIKQGKFNYLFFGITKSIVQNSQFSKDPCTDPNTYGFRPGQGKCNNNWTEHYGNAIQSGDFVTILVDRINHKVSF